MLKKSVLSLSLAAALLAASGVSAAATTNTSLSVSASISRGCSISTTAALAFGAYDPVGVNATAALNATGQVSVACSKGAAGLTIGMDNGTHVSGTQRQMQGAEAADVLRYNVFQPPNSTPGTACTFPGTIAWTATGTGLLTLDKAPSKDVRLYNVCGTIPAGQDANTGTYADTISATLTF